MLEQRLQTRALECASVRAEQLFASLVLPLLRRTLGEGTFGKVSCLRQKKKQGGGQRLFVCSPAPPRQLVLSSLCLLQQVKFAINTETGEKVAVKILDKEKIQKQNMGAQIKKEVRERLGQAFPCDQN